MRRSPLVIVAAGACVLVLASCSSDKKTQVDSTSPPVSLSGAVNDKGTKDASGDGAKPTLELEIDDNYFNPTFTQFAPGAVVTVELKNEGTRDHTFTLADGGTDQTLKAGESAEVTVTVPTTGSVNFFCRIHKNAGMQGAFYTSGSGSSSGSSSGSGSGSGSSTTSTGSTSTTKASSGGYGY